MKWLQSAEAKLAELFAKVPDLPSSARRVLGANIWWIVIIVAIINGLTLFVKFKNAVTSAVYFSNNQIYILSPTQSNILATNYWLVFVFGLASTILLFAAIAPLRRMQRSGWLMLFVYELLGALLLLIGIFVELAVYGNFPVGTLLSIVMILLELYILFQIRGEFRHQLAAGRKADAIEAEIVETNHTANKKTKKS